MGSEPHNAALLESDSWLDLELFRGSFPRSPASPAKVQGTIFPDPHQDTQSVNRGVKRIEQLRMRPGEEEALGIILSPGQQGYVHGGLSIPVYDDREVNAKEREESNEREVDVLEREVGAFEHDESLEDDDGPRIEGAYCMRQEAFHGGVFLKKYIPERDSFPALHDHL